MKLAIYIKDKFKAKVISETFKKREELIAESRVKLANRVYMNQGTQRVTLLETLPKDSLCISKEIRCHFNGQRVTLMLETALPQNCNLVSSSYRFASTDKLCIAWENIRHEEDILSDDKNKLREKLNSILNGCNTDEQLLEMWPEAADFLPKQEFKNLPAITGNEVRSLINELAGKGLEC